MGHILVEKDFRVGLGILCQQSCKSCYRIELSVTL